MRRVFKAVAGFGVLVMGCSASFPASDGPRSPLLDRAAPSLEAPTLDGALIRIPARDRPMVLDFWATWCAPCLKQMPRLAALHARYGSQVTFVGISGDDNPVTALKTLKKMSVSYPNILDGADRRFQGAYQVTDLPHTFVLDREGQVRLVLKGDRPQTLSRLEQALERLASEDP